MEDFGRSEMDPGGASPVLPQLSDVTVLILPSQCYFGQIGHSNIWSMGG